jgi:SAM-dependent methyltransferase
MVATRNPVAVGQNVDGIRVETLAKLSSGGVATRRTNVLGYSSRYKSSMDFGPSAQEYARHRRMFPSSLFDRIPLRGELLDLGAGTGALARGYAQRGARVVALELSIRMLAQAPDLPRRVVARAEACPFAAGSFEAVVAGQCWHWFDGPAVARECRRILRPQGTLAIAHFNYLLLPGSVAEASEALILERAPNWPLAGIMRMEGRWDADLRGAGFGDLASFSYEIEVQFTHEAWRGRMRACNGVLGLGGQQRAEYDEALARLLSASFPEPLSVRHEVFALVARAP